MKSMIKVNGHVRLKVSFVLQVVDNYTQKIINDPSLQVTAEGMESPIRKSEGYFVFLNCQKSLVKVTVTSPFYLSEVLWVEVQKIPRDYLVIKVRLNPQRQYPLIANTTCLEGKAPADILIELILDGGESGFRLLQDYTTNHKKGQIRLFHPERKEIDGMRFFITDRDRLYEDFFLITNEVTKDCYKLMAPLSRDYKMACSKIYGVYSTRADSFGYYFLPFRERITEPTDCSCFYNHNRLTYLLEPGIVNKKDLL